MTKNKNPDRLKLALEQTLEIAKGLNVEGYTKQDVRYIHLAGAINTAVNTFLITEVTR